MLMSISIKSFDPPRDPARMLLAAGIPLLFPSPVVPSPFPGGCRISQAVHFPQRITACGKTIAINSGTTLVRTRGKAWRGALRLCLWRRAARLSLI